jgi:hypothetical protein
MPKQKESTINDLSRKIDDLAQMTARGFESMVTKQELHALESKMQNGFSLMMKIIEPVHHDYSALKDDLAPRMDLAEARLTKVEHKIGI